MNLDGKTTMRTRRRLTSALAGTAAFACLLLSLPIAIHAKKPNVIMLLADDMGFGDLPCYGHPYARAPNICGRLAAQGTVFNNFHVAGITCNPSRTGFMTSRHPASFPNYMADFGLQGVRTLTQMLGEKAGYETGHFGKWHIGPDPPVGRRKEKKKAGGEQTDTIPVVPRAEGMDGEGNRCKGCSAAVQAAADGAGDRYGIDEVEIIGGKRNSAGGRDALTFDVALDFIQEHVEGERRKQRERKLQGHTWGADDETPFYVNIWGHIPHTPIMPPPAMTKLFDDVVVNPDDFGRNMATKLREWGAYDKHTWMEKDMKEYLAEIWAIDQACGRLFDKLEQLGIFDDTIVVFTSDQGASPGAAGSSGVYKGGKFSFHEGGVRVPFIARWPNGGIPAGATNEHSLMSALDWTPTILSLAGVSYDPSWFEGEDVSDIWRNSANPNVRSRTNPLFWKLSNEGGSQAMLYKNWKLHMGPGTQRALYNLEANPEEDFDVFNLHPDVGNAMLDDLQKWRAQLPVSYCKIDRSCSQLFYFDPMQNPVVVGPPLLLSLGDGPVPPPTPWVPPPTPPPPTPAPIATTTTTATTAVAATTSLRTSEAATTKAATTASAPAPTFTAAAPTSSAPVPAPTTDSPVVGPTTDSPVAAPTTDSPVMVNAPPSDDPTLPPTAEPTAEPTPFPTLPPVDAVDTSTFEADGVNVGILSSSSGCIGPSGLAAAAAFGWLSWLLLLG